MYIYHSRYARTICRAAGPIWPPSVPSCVSQFHLVALRFIWSLLVPSSLSPFLQVPFRYFWSLSDLRSIWSPSVPSGPFDLSVPSVLLCFIKSLSVSSGLSPFLLVPLRFIWFLSVPSGPKLTVSPAPSVVWLLLHVHWISWTLIKIINDIRLIRLKPNMTR